jgi:hypothetical protein
LGKLLLLPANVRLDWKVIASANALAYLASSTLTKKNKFLELPPGVKCYKTFSFVADDEAQ